MPEKCYKCGKVAEDNVLVTYPDDDKWTCLECLKKYGKKVKESFH